VTHLLWQILRMALFIGMCVVSAKSYDRVWIGVLAGSTIYLTFIKVFERIV